MTKFTVLFIETHWMTSVSRQKVALVYDNAPSHCSKADNGYVKVWNGNPKNTYSFVIKFVDPCLNSIYQPSDIVYNKLFKASIRKKYNDSISTRLTSGNFNVRDKYKVSRDALIHFIYETIDELNRKYFQSK